MKEIVIATKNRGKLKEIEQILDLPSLQLLDLSAFPRCAALHVEENGNSFEENALIKARSYHACVKKAVLADDSGLVVPALNGEPGIYSARYAGPQSDDAQNNALLLQKMKGLSGEKRAAYFQCVLAFVDGGEEHTFYGRCHGTIGFETRGNKGFGYDPLFFVPEQNKTFAELEKEQKNSISHRADALRKFRDFLGG